MAITFRSKTVVFAGPDTPTRNQCSASGKNLRYLIKSVLSRFCPVAKAPVRSLNRISRMLFCCRCRQRAVVGLQRIDMIQHTQQFRRAGVSP